MASTSGVRREAREARGSVILGGLAMLVLSFFLFWLPLLGPLTAGFVGGWIVRRPGRAVAVALLPAVALALLVGGVLTAFHLPLLGALSGAMTLLVVVIHEIPLFVGAALGGAAAA
jgi:hypothetical protein